MKHKIAILTHNMAGGGAERFVSHLARNLKDDFEVHLVMFEKTVEYDLPKDQILKVIDDNVDKRHNLINILRIPLTSYQFAKYCKSNKIDLILSFVNRPNFVACFTKIIGLKIPVLISEQTYTPFWFKEDNLRGKIAKRMVAWLYPKADAILPNSKGTRMALENHYGVKSNYFVIKNIVDIDEIEQKSHEDVVDVQFDRFTFLHLGSFSYMKGHRLLVNAFARLQRKDVQLLLIGKGLMSDGIKKQVEMLGLEDQVLFLGHQSNPFKYMARADCFVLASDFEGFPNVLTEAMACGLPVISTDCLTGPRELLAPDSSGQSQIKGNFELGKFGVLVPVNDEIIMAAAMKEMLNNKELRTSHMASVKNEAANYDRHIVIEDLKHILKQFLSPI